MVRQVAGPLRRRATSTTCAPHLRSRAPPIARTRRRAAHSAMRRSTIARCSMPVGARGLNALTVSYGAALADRAVLDALCRMRDVSIGTALWLNLPGLGADLTPDLAHFDFDAFLSTLARAGGDRSAAHGRHGRSVDRGRTRSRIRPRRRTAGHARRRHRPLSQPPFQVEAERRCRDRHGAARAHRPRAGRRGRLSRHARRQRAVHRRGDGRRVPAGAAQRTAPRPPERRHPLSRAAVAAIRSRSPATFVSLPATCR